MCSAPNDRCPRRLRENRAHTVRLSGAAPYFYRQRLAALSRVHAGRDRMTSIRADGGAAAAERSQEDNCTECGEKNGSHNNLVTVFLTIRRQSRR